ncbi:MAG: DUF2846 domain-containing protein [Arenimonas sp.]
MKFYAPLTAAVVLGLAFATSSFAQDTNQTEAAPVTTDAAPQAVAAPAVDTATSQIPEDVLNVVGKPETGKALIVFFRANRFAGAAVSFKVREGEVELGKLKSGSYILAQVEPGKHTYTVHSEAKDVTNIEAEEGETYFIAGTISMGLMVGRPNLTPSDAAKFQSEMKKMKAAR